ncbi:tRNA-guanine(15) transglycosylase-like protein [Russula earlei]|uniref:tRNA-guanine(15) transglycosylase-like protein n=1 Tax=Russula earlei TaxID=71964 RepID=A0ACC0UPK8_9AGAM|nr:tRNA-guanine(15) transglycosylase-like protein [Russula earlei]
MSLNHHLSALRFHIQSTPATFSPRLGTVTLCRLAEDISIDLQTPGLITSTSRGVVPHLSSDHVRVSDAVRWIHVPFESFLELSPPLPTLHPGPYPSHACLGLRPNRHVLTMSLRDPADDRDMPPNGNDFVSALCLRGVRKVTPNEWRDYTLSAQPDVLVALSDVPLTSGPHSQKRITKSIERSASWLANLLRPLPGRHVSAGAASHLLNVLVHMAGGIAPKARQAFSRSLLEPLFDKEAEAIRPLNNLDQGVAGYTFDLAPLRKSLSPDAPRPAPTGGLGAGIDPFSVPPAPSVTAQIISLIRTSLEPLPATKPRVVHSAGSPHEILALIRDIGIDLFDAHWAQRAADVGVALDFVFPAPADISGPAPREIGHNFYDERYSHDFSPFADALRSCTADQLDERPPCTCMACAPSRPSEPLKHSRVDEAPPLHAPVPYTRAYVHHLLHTHEMSAHTLLALHNLAVLDTFFAGVRRVLSERPAALSQEIRQFEQTYDGKLGVLAEAKKAWTEVNLARGKGRLAREREREKQRQRQDTLGTAVELN